MYRTFNCGVGMVLVVDASDANNIIESLEQIGENAVTERKRPGFLSAMVSAP